jgi:hypothetical protein
VVALSLTCIRDYAAAFVAATVAALVVDAALQLALDAVAVSAYGSAPWWITAHLAERGRWVMFAALLWWLAPHLVPPAALTPVTETAGARDEAEAWRQVGIAVIAVPLLWVVATLVVDYAPWPLAGVTVLGLRRHL